MSKVVECVKFSLCIHAHTHTNTHTRANKFVKSEIADCVKEREREKGSRKRWQKRNFVLEAHVEKFSTFPLLAQFNQQQQQQQQQMSTHTHSHAQQNRVDLAENVAFSFYFFFYLVGKPFSFTIAGQKSCSMKFSLLFACVL